MSLTKPQNCLYWREWAAAKRVLMPGRETWTKQEENERRHGITIETLGFDKSHLEFSNVEFDQILGALRAISRPTDVDAQLRQIRGEHRRGEHVLEQLMRRLGKDRNYVQGVVDNMNFPRRGAALSYPKLEELTAAERGKVIFALRLHKGAGNLGANRRKKKKEAAPF